MCIKKLVPKSWSNFFILLIKFIASFDADRAEKPLTYVCMNILSVVAKRTALEFRLKSF